mgnify:CR=1 FL=1
MIAALSGTVVEHRDSSLLLAVGPVTFEVHVPSATIAKATAGEVLMVHTFLQIRDEIPVLYGFSSHAELTMFRKLVADVSGIGPRTALNILSAIPLNVFVNAVTSGDTGMLTAAPGVGKRTAERIIVELSNRLPEEVAHLATATAPVTDSTAGKDALDALLALGYRDSAVRGVVTELVAENPGAEAEQLIRKALARLR